MIGPSNVVFANSHESAPLIEIFTGRMRRFIPKKRIGGLLVTDPDNAVLQQEWAISYYTLNSGVPDRQEIEWRDVPDVIEGSGE